jgi:hypothetical protein
MRVVSTSQALTWSMFYWLGKRHFPDLFFLDRSKNWIGPVLGHWPFLLRLDEVDRDQNQNHISRFASQGTMAKTT